jgi:Zn-dependent protease with chaperone function/acyl dehydratase
MNFFEQQERARRNTGWLLFLFTVAVIGLGFGVYGATMAGLHVSRGHFPVSGFRYEFGTSRAPGYRSTHRPSPDAPARASVPRRAAPLGWWRPDIFIGCFSATLGVIGLASLGRTAGLRAGGIAVAEMMGARVVPPGTQEVRERRLRNVVEEMALAASVPVPQIFVLDEEGGINAFAAGHTPADAAIVVTRGTLEHLNREELQGVIGHEFSHILNGDMRMNVRIMGLLFGILVIAVIGRGLLRIMSFGRGGRGRGGGGFAAFLVAGALVTLIGYAGLFCARLIKAAVSRQREYLADAASVQFTRNADGIAGALKKIGGFVFGSQVKARRAEEASHFFFSDAVSYSLFSGLFATHPPLHERIRRVDPSFDGHYPQVRLLAADAVEDGASGAEAFEAAGFAPAGQGVARIATDPASVTRLVGNPNPDHTDYAAALLRELPDALREAMGSAFSASALIYAMLLSEDAAVRERQVATVRTGLGAEMERETWRLAAALGGTEARWRLPVAKLALPALRAMTPAQQEAFAGTVGALITADAQVSLFEFAISRTLVRHLAAGRVAPPRATVRTLGPVLDDCRTLLSCLARQGQPDEIGAQRAYAAGAARLQMPTRLGLLGSEACSLEATGAALDRLRTTVPRVREQILDACAHGVLADATVTLEEAELLRVVADALDCPLPPFLTPAA